MKTSTIFTITFLLITTILFSCGPSAEETAMIQARHDDSIKVVTENAMRAKIAIDKRAEEKRIEKEKQVERAKNSKARIENELIELNSQLVVLKDRLNHAQEFQIGRSRSTREQQLRDGANDIQRVERRMQELKGSLNKIAEFMQANQ